MVKRSFLLAVILSFFIVSCTQEQGPVIPVVNPETVSFSEDIQPIFDAKCTSCHKAALEQYFGNLNLEPDFSYDELVNIESDGFAPQMRVVPEDIEKSVLWKKINESGDLEDNMPLGAEALPASEQELIKTWIQEGALNN